MMSLVEMISNTYDWISPLIRFWERWRYGPGRQFWLSRASGFTGGQAERLLQRYGIRCYDRWVSPEDFVWRVPAKMGKYAEWVLAKHGMPAKGEV